MNDDEVTPRQEKAKATRETIDFNAWLSNEPPPLAEGSRTALEQSNTKRMAKRVRANHSRQNFFWLVSLPFSPRPQLLVRVLTWGETRRYRFVASCFRCTKIAQNQMNEHDEFTELNRNTFSSERLCGAVTVLHPRETVVAIYHRLTRH